MKLAGFRIILIGLWAGFFIQASAQEGKTIKGKIVDIQSGKPIPFATIRLTTQRGLGGLISNADGDFQFPSGYRYFVDTVIISCIGYLNKAILIDDLKEEQLNLLNLKPAPIQLKEVSVKAKKMGTIFADEIVRAAIKSIPYNYPSEPFSYVAYYRDYQLLNDSYMNLNEAIVEIFDRGFNSNDQLTSKIKLYEYRKNSEFPRDTVTEIPYDNKHHEKFIPGAALYSFGGNELTILRVHDAIRNNKNFAYSFVDMLSSDFANNHFFTMEGLVHLNEVPLYHIKFESRPSVTDKLHFATGQIYIEKDNFAIHKLEYSTFEKRDAGPKLLYTILLEYARINSLMYLNYISFNNLFQIEDPGDFKIVNVVLDRYLNALIITVNNSPDRESASNERNYDIRLGNDKLEIDRIEIIDKIREIRLHFKTTLPPTESVATLAPKIKLDIKNIKNLRGRELNAKKFVTANQYRELFVQKKTTHTGDAADTLYVHIHEPLSRNVITTSKEFDISSYWMNSPLKK